MRRGWVDKRLLSLLLAILVLGAVHYAPTPGAMVSAGEAVALSDTAKTTLSILAFAIVLWVTEAVPFSVTALIVLLLLPAFGVMSFEETVRLGFGDPIITFFIGVLVLSAAVTQSGLGNRLMYFMLSKVGNRTDRMILGFLTVGVVLSMWITDMAVAAILLPLGVKILREVGANPLESNFGKALMIASCWGPLIGGIGTPAGTGVNLLAINFLKELVGLRVSFIQWMMMGVPAAFLMLPLAWQVLVKMFPPEIKTLPVAKADSRKKLTELGPLTSKEIRTLLVSSIAVALWISSPVFERVWGLRVPIAAVALLAGTVAFLPGIDIMTWKEAESQVDWGGIVLIAGGISLGTAVYNTGAARWLASVMVGGLRGTATLLSVFLVALVVAVMKVMFSSNTVTGVIIIPLLIALAQDLGINPWIMAAPAAFSSSLAFILVTSSPTNVIPYSAGYFTIKDMAMAGLVMTVIAAVCVTASLLAFGPLAGMPLR